jgi:hypothetical protein
MKKLLTIILIFISSSIGFTDIMTKTQTSEQLPVFKIEGSIGFTDVVPKNKIPEQLLAFENMIKAFEADIIQRDRQATSITNIADVKPKNSIIVTNSTANINITLPINVDRSFHKKNIYNIVNLKQQNSNNVDLNNNRTRCYYNSINGRSYTALKIGFISLSSAILYYTSKQFSKWFFEPTNSDIMSDIRAYYKMYDFMV